MRYQTILFDADGTLLDFERSEYEALSDVLAEFEIPETSENHKIYSAANAEQWRLLELGLVTKSELRTNRFASFLEQIGFSASPAAMADSYALALSKKSYLLDGAESLCRELHGRGCELYIITNGFAFIQKERRFQNSSRWHLCRRWFNDSLSTDRRCCEIYQHCKRLLQQLLLCCKKNCILNLKKNPHGIILCGFYFCFFEKKPFFFS